jgi:hypothetical protein
MQTCFSVPCSTPFGSPRGSLKNQMAHQSPFRLSAGIDSATSFTSTSDRVSSFSENGQTYSPTGATRPNWRSRSSRAFSPLTPIIASPLSTPAPSVSPHAVSLNSDVIEDKNSCPLTQEPPATRSGRPTDPDPKVALSFNIPTPTWTSTPPTPPPNFIYRSKTVTSHPMSCHPTASASLPDATIAEGSTLSSPTTRKRRASLPLIALSKPLPPIPLSSPQAHQSSAPPGLKLAASPPRCDPIRSPRTEQYIPQRRLEKSSSPPISQGKAVFHLAPDSSDREDDGRGENVLGRSDSSEPDSAVIPVVPELHLLVKKPPNTGRVRENSRRCHALSELLSTEVGYLLDLRTLVSVSILLTAVIRDFNMCLQVYLRLLPILTNRPSSVLHGSSSNLNLGHFSRPSSTHAIYPLTTSLRTQSYPHLSGSTQLTSAPSSTESYGASAPSAYPGREKDKYAIRHLFSPSDLDTITRNAEEILEFHERLVRELRAVVSPFGFPMSLGGKPDVNHAQSHAVQRAINAVSAVFIDHVRPLISLLFLLLNARAGFWF